MPALLLTLAAVVFAGAVGFAADPAEELEPDYTQYALETFTAKPGKLDALHAWFRAHQDDVLAKHGAENIAYFVPAGENPDSKILALYRHPSLRALMQFSRAVKADPLWKPLDTAIDGPELLVEKVAIMTFRTTDFSPKFTPAKSAEPRVFELRTYTCPSPDMLFHLHDRFREHTMKLFEKHGMENLVYWRPLDIEDSNQKLIYLLGHKSQEAAKASFAAFRADPDWLAAKKASEEKAGGSLTNPEGGVVSEFLVPTAYSPLK
jgi:hypothetical protein